MNLISTKFLVMFILLKLVNNVTAAPIVRQDADRQDLAFARRHAPQREADMDGGGPSEPAEQAKGAGRRQQPRQRRRPPRPFETVRMQVGQAVDLVGPHRDDRKGSAHAWAPGRRASGARK